MFARTIRQTLGFWQWLAVACLLGGLPTAASAGVQEIRVLGVGVNSSSLEAEQIAMDYAKKRAVYLAARKLKAKDADAAVAKFGEEEYREIVRGMVVSDTRRKDEVTYLDVSVSVVDEALRRALKLPPDNGANAAKHQTKPVMLLPLLVDKQRSYLWEKDNTLRRAVSDEVRRQALGGGVLLPSGDLQDLRLIDYQNAMTVTPEELKPMFDRYGVQEIIVAAAKFSDPGTSDATQIVLRRLERARIRNEVMEIAPESSEETSLARQSRAANAIAGAVTQIATSTAEADRAARDKAKKVKFVLEYSTPKELAFLQEKLTACEEVLVFDLPSISLARAEGTLYLKSDGANLVPSLTKAGVRVEPSAEALHLFAR